MNEPAPDYVAFLWLELVIEMLQATAAECADCSQDQHPRTESPGTTQERLAADVPVPEGALDAWELLSFAQLVNCLERC